ncbi:MAG: hypothetical protein ACRDSP_12165 [Pseudonocardiaceae bacterium]
MGTLLTGYGEDGYDHEGYAAQVLDDGSITGTYSNATCPRMIGHVVAACGCGWAGTTRYPCPGPFDEQAEALALAEWETPSEDRQYRTELIWAPDSGNGWSEQPGWTLYIDGAPVANSTRDLRLAAAQQWADAQLGEGVRWLLGAPWWYFLATPEPGR